MRLTARLRDDESGAALITALLCTMVMLALGLALLAIVDTQANESSAEVTRDRAFNLSESVLTSEAFILGRNWPEAPTGFANCNLAGAAFGDTFGSTAPPSTPTARLRPNLDATYTDGAYDNASWQVNICDDDGTSVWTDSILLTKAPYDANNNERVWVRAQSTVAGRTRALVGLVKVREVSALNAKYGLVSGAFSDDLGPATSAITNATVLSGLTNGLLTTNAPVAPDLPTHPVPASGVTALRCGLLDRLTELKPCVTGALGALSAVPAFDDLVTGGTYEQFPTTTSADAGAIGQLRKQAQTSPGVYIAAPLTGSASAASAPACTGLPASNANAVVFIEKIGAGGDEYCFIDVSTSRTYKALVIGSGRIIIRGSDTITPYASAPNNRFTGVVYALNLQTANHGAAINPPANPAREVVRIEKAARVTGAVHADGKNATVGLIAPDFDSDALVCALVSCPSVTATLLQGLGVTELVDTLVNGVCVVPALLGSGCALALAGVPAATVLSKISSQLTVYGSAINSDTAVVNALKVYGASGVTPGTFRDLQPR